MIKGDERGIQDGEKIHSVDREGTPPLEVIAEIMGLLQESTAS